MNWVLLLAGLMAWVNAFCFIEAGEERLLMEVLCPEEDLEECSLAEILCSSEDPKNISYYGSNYMISRGSDFGGSQDEYLFWSRVSIVKARKMIEESPKNQETLSLLFSQVLEFLAQRRRQLAFDHKTPAAGEFGSRRDGALFAQLSYTPFTRGYREYGQQILSSLKEELSKMEKDDKRFIQKRRFTEDCSFGLRSSLEIQVFDPKDIKEQGLLELAFSGLPPGFPIELCNRNLKNEEDQARLRAALRDLKKQDPLCHARLRIMSMIVYLMKIYPSPFKAGQKEGELEWVGDLANLKSTYVLATIHCEIGGRMLPIYQYLTWIYRDPDHPEEDFLERMLRCSTVTIIHQEYDYVEETLQGVAKTFAKAVLWDQKDLSELKKEMALLRYGLACMPFGRGSAAISEWLEAAIYEYHGIRYKIDPNRLVDLEVYANPLFANFYKAYGSMVQLEKGMPCKK